MEPIYNEKARKDLRKMDINLARVFIKHADKIASLPPRRHMKYGMPFNVDEVEGRGRLVYEYRGEQLFIVRCFDNHKDYEKWYRSYKRK
jgi:hypothetical protein